MSDVSAYAILPAGSPDATSLVDLSIYDLDAAAIYAQALQDAQAAFPTWNPQAGSQEVVILQAMAIAAAELGYAINRLPLSVLQALAVLFNVQPAQGSAPQATITVTFSDTVGHLLPQGTMLSYSPSGSGAIYFTTDYDLNVATGLSSGSVTITGTTATTSVNGTPIGTAIQNVNSTTPIQNIVLLTALAGGTNPETTQAWLTRAAGVLQATTNTVVLPSQFQTTAVDTEGVWRSNTLDNFEPSYYSQWGASAGASVLGNVTVAVYGQGQVPVTTAVKQQLQTQLAANCVAGLAVNVIDANVTTVGASISALAQAGWASTDVANSIISAIQSGTSTIPGVTTDQWPWGRPVRVLDVYHLVSSAAGVDYVSSIALTTSTAGASVVGGASVGSPITLQNPANLLPSSPDTQSFEDGTHSWGASVGWQLFWPYNQGSYQAAASVGNSTTWAALGTHSEEIVYSNSYAASVNPSLWLTNPPGLSIPTLPTQSYTLSLVADFGTAGASLNMGYANQLLWLIQDSAGNAYQANVSASVSASGIATFLGTFETGPNAGNINSMVLFIMAGYGSTPGWVNGPVYIDNIGFWAGSPATATGTSSGGTTSVTGFVYTAPPPIVANFVAGDVLLGGIPSLALATLGSCYVEVANAAASPA